MKTGAKVILWMMAIISIVLVILFVSEFLSKTNADTKDWCKYYNVKTGDKNVNWACCVQILQDAGCTRPIDGFCNPQSTYEELQKQASDLYKQHGAKCML
jgi:hypothetical protein